MNLNASVDPLEALADAEHDSWARWMAYLFSKCHEDEDGSVYIPGALVERWRRQVDTPYFLLSEREKESDRDEVRVVLRVLDAAGFAVVTLDALRRLGKAVGLLNSMVLCGEQHTDASRAIVMASSYRILSRDIPGEEAP